MRENKDLNKLSFEDLKKELENIEKQKSEIAVKEYGWKIGQNYLIRTVTHIQVGKLINITDKEIFLEDASWIADTGRFCDMLKNGLENQQSSEIEPFIDIVGINRGALVDFVKYNHKLPKNQK